MMMLMIAPAVACIAPDASGALRGTPDAQGVDAMLRETLVFDRGARKEAGELLARWRLHLAAGRRGATPEELRRRLNWPEEQALLNRLWGGWHVRSGVRALAEGRASGAPACTPGAAREMLWRRLDERLLEIVRATPALRDAPGGDVATARMLADNLLASL